MASDTNINEERKPLSPWQLRHRDASRGLLTANDIGALLVAQRGRYERLRAAPRTTPSISTPPDTDDGTRHEADRQADVASERYDEQRDRCDNEPLLCIRHRSHVIN
jgi:hypothetical protein